MPGIDGGHTLSRRPEKAGKTAAKKSIQRDSTRISGSGEMETDTESPDHCAFLGQADEILRDAARVLLAEGLRQGSARGGKAIRKQKRHVMAGVLGVIS
jgi:hypothetical protein